MVSEGHKLLQPVVRAAARLSGRTSPSIEKDAALLRRTVGLTQHLGSVADEVLAEIRNESTVEASPASGEGPLRPELLAALTTFDIPAKAIEDQSDDVKKMHQIVSVVMDGSSKGVEAWGNMDVLCTAVREPLDVASSSADSRSYGLCNTLGEQDNAATAQQTDLDNALGWGDIAKMSESEILRRLLKAQEGEVARKARACMAKMLRVWPESEPVTTEDLGGWDTLQKLLRLMIQNQAHFQEHLGALQAALSKALQVEGGGAGLLAQLQEEASWHAVGSLFVVEDPPQRGTEESAHPYSNNMNEVKCISCPGATRIRFEFDPQTKTENGCDWLYFYRDEALSDQIAELNCTGTTKPTEHVTISADRVWMKFHSDGSNTDWGYKFEYWNPDHKPQVRAVKPVFEVTIWILKLLVASGTPLFPGLSAALLAVAFQVPAQRGPALLCMAEALRAGVVQGDLSAVRETFNGMYTAAEAAGRRGEVAALADLLLLLNQQNKKPVEVTTYQLAKREANKAYIAACAASGADAPHTVQLKADLDQLKKMTEDEFNAAQGVAVSEEEVLQRKAMALSRLSGGQLDDLSEVSLGEFVGAKAGSVVLDETDCMFEVKGAGSLVVNGKYRITGASNMGAATFSNGPVTLLRRTATCWYFVMSGSDLNDSVGDLYKLSQCDQDDVPIGIPASRW